MTDTLPDTIGRLYTEPAEYIDSDHPAVAAFARAAVPAGAGAREAAARLYIAVRDGIRYNPYVSMQSPESFRASSVLAAGNGYCVGKAALYAAACRVHGIPARVGFADVRNHLTTEKLRASMGTDMFTWHGFTEVYVDGAWRKATPTFNDTLCAKLGVAPLDFDGHSDALLHPFDGAGRTYMQYVNDHGSYHDVPAKFLMREMAREYANMQSEDFSGRDMEREAAEQ
ncbi:transglutaminase domain-containing protein [Bradyrhizobium sp. WSM 1704]|uniref:transglutaminase-like domain-containing protein n=1 Tax=Bradyrhizobium semiaridum TaxID=2821404 RepID=UPI001CE2BA75|nr:transglutaminase-like domain-containing protein [Bradyrhizobium semiaridum]MCA6124923.1 transglutaminase domain-containing protein [Bradyrhizobium semiaridum]